LPHFFGELMKTYFRVQVEARAPSKARSRLIVPIIRRQRFDAMVYIMKHACLCALIREFLTIICGF